MAACRALTRRSVPAEVSVRSTPSARQSISTTPAPTRLERFGAFRFHAGQMDFRAAGSVRRQPPNPAAQIPSDEASIRAAPRCHFSFQRLRLPSPVRSRGTHLGRAQRTAPRPSFELQRASAPRLSRRGDAGVAVHAEQRRASGAERDRHLVRRPALPGGDLGHGRSVLARAGIHHCCSAASSLSVQTLVAHAYGAPRYARASQAAVDGLWASLVRRCPHAPPSPSTGTAIFSPFGIPKPPLSSPSLLVSAHSRGPLGIALYVTCSASSTASVGPRHAANNAHRRARSTPCSIRYSSSIRARSRRLRLGDRRCPARRAGRRARLVSWAGPPAAAFARTSRRAYGCARCGVQLSLGFPMGLLIRRRYSRIRAVPAHAGAPRATSTARRRKSS